MRISDWSSDVCSSDLAGPCANALCHHGAGEQHAELERHVGDDRDRCVLQRMPGDDHPFGQTGEPLEAAEIALQDRKSVVEGNSVSARVDTGGCRIIKTKRTYSNPHR